MEEMLIVNDVHITDAKMCYLHAEVLKLKEEILALIADLKARVGVLESR